MRSTCLRSCRNAEVRSKRMIFFQRRSYTRMGSALPFLAFHASRRCLMASNEASTSSGMLTAWMSVFHRSSSASVILRAGGMGSAYTSEVSVIMARKCWPFWMPSTSYRTSRRSQRGPKLSPPGGSSLLAVKMARMFTGVSCWPLRYTRSLMMVSSAFWMEELAFQISSKNTTLASGM